MARFLYRPNQPEALTQDRLKEVLDYDVRTGNFWWKVTPTNTCKVGMRAGSLNGRYRYVRVDNKRYSEHQLAWFFVYGEWVRNLDHVDTDGTNNSLANLRKASAFQQQGNRKPNKNSKSGIKGVRKVKGRWQARLGRSYLGSFLTPTEAQAAYEKAATKLFGEFVRV